MFKFFTATLIPLCLASPALADVCELNSKEVATKAAKMLSQIDVVLSYCGACGDSTAQSIPVTETKAAATDDATLFEVQINGKGVDLGYIYFLKSKESQKWVNLGLIVGCADATAFDTLELPKEIVDHAVMAP